MQKQDHWGVLRTRFAIKNVLVVNADGLVVDRMLSADFSFDCGHLSCSPIWFLWQAKGSAKQL
jgi:hypothetical protein